GSGFLIGVFTAEMKLSFVQDEIVGDVMLGNRGYVYLINQEKRIIGYSHDAKRVGTTLSLSVAENMLTDTSAAELIKNERYKNEAGESVFASMRSLPELRIAVIAEWPEQDALEVVRTIQKQITVFVLSTFGLILLASLLLARQVTKPIQMLRAGAQLIGGGKFEHRIALPRHDELGELAESFNDMAVQLKKLDELKAIQIRSEALADSLKKEQELSRQKDVFISVMSHQLRTPLTALQWGMEYLSGETGKPELATYGDTIKDAAESSQQITAIVDDLLTVSELGIGYVVKKTEAVDVGVLLKELQSALDKRVKEKKLTFTLALPEAPFVIDANPSDMRKIFMNLFDNAIIYTKEGGVTVTGKDQGDSVVVTVADTGIGIPANERKDVFREFFRATNAIVGKNVGTGLGLFIVKTIVQGHGGSVAVVSEENKGTTLTVTLPKKQGQKETKEV
ncbi:MAG: ATP-binding protein, partial [bacterium]|nr:ATP-binding protein [bacterium]